jgi:putative transposase
VDAHQKKAARDRRHLVFIDESGVLMGPLLRRTWAPRGQTPQLQQRGKHRDRVSIAAALWWAPWRRQALGLYYETLVNGYFNNLRVREFLERLLRALPEKILVVWDGGGMHKGDPIREAAVRFAPRLHLERLPPYAPMLNPVESVWSWLKYSRLANYAPPNAAISNHRIHQELDAISHDQDFLGSMWRASDLPVPFALLM